MKSSRPEASGKDYDNFGDSLKGSQLDGYFKRESETDKARDTYKIFKQFLLSGFQPQAVNSFSSIKSASPEALPAFSASAKDSDMMIRLQQMAEFYQSMAATPLYYIGGTVSTSNLNLSQDLFWNKRISASNKQMKDDLASNLRCKM